jgi:hypothetical protein
MRKDAGNVDPTVWEVADHAIMPRVGHVNPSGYNMVEGKIPKEKRGALPSRRRRCEKEVARVACRC